MSQIKKDEFYEIITVYLREGVTQFLKFLIKIRTKFMR